MLSVQPPTIESDLFSEVGHLKALLSNALSNLSNLSNLLEELHTHRGLRVCGHVLSSITNFSKYVGQVGQVGHSLYFQPLTVFRGWTEVGQLGQRLSAPSLPATTTGVSIGASRPKTRDWIRSTRLITELGAKTRHHDP